MKQDNKGQLQGVPVENTLNVLSFYLDLDLDLDSALLILWDDSFREIRIPADE